MPNFDGTGPLGKGPGTGKGRGKCKGGRNARKNMGIDGNRPKNTNNSSEKDNKR